MAKLVASTYGDALFELAVQENKTDQLYEEALAVIDAFDKNGELAKFLNHPKIDKKEKQTSIENIFNEFVSKDIVGLMVIMISKDRQAKIVDTLKVFVQRVKEYKKIGTAYVSTAIELSDVQKNAVVNRLLATTQYKQFEVTYIVDPSLIGGMVIRIGDRVVDSSIKTKLDELTKNLRKIQLV